MFIEYDFTSFGQIEEYIENRIESKPAIPSKVTKIRKVKRIDIHRNPRSQQIKSLKALVRIDDQIMNMTIDTGSPVSFLNWATAKQILEVSKYTNFRPMENLNQSAQFVDYKKPPLAILRAITANICSAGWESIGASFLITKRRTRCILGLDLQHKAGIHTTQKSAPREKTRFDVLLCEQSEGWKQQFCAIF